MWWAIFSPTNNLNSIAIQLLLNFPTISESMESNKNRNAKQTAPKMPETIRFIFWLIQMKYTVSIERNINAKWIHNEKLMPHKRPHVQLILSHNSHSCCYIVKVNFIVNCFGSNGGTVFFFRLFNEQTKKKRRRKKENVQTSRSVHYKFFFIRYQHFANANQLILP